MLTERIAFSWYNEAETASEAPLLRDPAQNLGTVIVHENNGQTVSPEPKKNTETETNQAEHLVDSRFVPPIFNLVRSDFKLLQLWQGRVDEVSNDSFIATIFDKTNPQGSPEQISISIEDVEPEDRILLWPGSVFYWSIGYANYTRGPRQRTSRIRFRRLVIPKRKMIEHKNTAKELAALLSKHSG